MPTITLTTSIRAPRHRVFDLARSIEAHLDSTHGTAERAVAGVITGLIGPGDEVTWEARHFGVRQRLTVRITAFDRPAHFQDVMISGAFARMVHDHHFADDAAGTVMRDRFDFASPFGPLGALADRLVLLPYLRRFLIRRNGALRQQAESTAWRRYLLPKLA